METWVETILWWGQGVLQGIAHVHTALWHLLLIPKKPRPWDTREFPVVPRVRKGRHVEK